MLGGPVHEVRIRVQLDHTRFCALEEEAKHRGVRVESIVEQFVHGLIRELDRDEMEGTDHPIIPS